LSDFNRKWNISTNFRKNPQYKTSQKSVPWKSRCPMQTDEGTGMTTVSNVSKIFADASTNRPTPCQQSH